MGDAPPGEAGDRHEAGANSLGDLIRRHMADHGWTLQTVAERSGLSVPTIWALREGTRGKRPRRETLSRLADGLGVPVDALLSAVDDASSNETAARETALLRLYRALGDEAKRSVEEHARTLARAASRVEVPVQSASRAKRR